MPSPRHHLGRADFVMLDLSMTEVTGTHYELRLPWDVILSTDLRLAQG
jgi:hypothetical protein